MSHDAASPRIEHDRANRRFVARVDGVEAHLEYDLDGATMTITHTIVPEAIGGRGIASHLVGAAFAAAREQGWKVRPQCSYAAAWAQKHPDAADLLAR